jgi:hypothetical protein
VLWRSVAFIPSTPFGDRSGSFVRRAMMTEAAMVVGRKNISNGVARPAY